MLEHRGPDSDGYYEDNNVGLAIRRLSIIDLDGGNQPISNEDEKIWTVFNGEIYNCNIIIHCYSGGLIFTFSFIK